MDHWSAAPRPEPDDPTLSIMTGWSSYHGRSMLRALAVVAAIAVTAAAFWLPSPDGGSADVDADHRGAAPPAATAEPGTASPTPSTVTTPAGPTPTPTTAPAPTVTSNGPTTPPGSPGTRSSTAAATRPAVTYDNTAAFTNISDEASVDRCERLTGKSSLAPSKTLLTGHRRTSPEDTTYYFYYIDNFENGNVPRTWTTRTWFGSSPYGQRYDLFLLVMDVDDARQFWAANQHPSGAYADATALPSTAVVAARLSVVQTGTADC